MQNMTTVSYKGDVKVCLKIKDKIIDIQNHNAGLPALSRAFCQFITGNSLTIEDLPEFIDLRFNSGSAWESCLVARVPLSGKSWVYDDSTGNYVAKFTGVISYNYLNRVITRNDTTDYRLYIYSGSLGPDGMGNYSGYYDFAYLDISAESLSYISPGTQAIIEWSMQLVNYSEE